MEKKQANLGYAWKVSNVDNSDSITISSSFKILMMMALYFAMPKTLAVMQ